MLFIKFYELKTKLYEVILLILIKITKTLYSICKFAW